MPRDVVARLIKTSRQAQTNGEDHWSGCERPERMNMQPKCTVFQLRDDDDGDGDGDGDGDDDDDDVLLFLQI